LLTKDKVKQVINDEKAQSIINLKQEEDLKDLTFKPKTNSFNHKLE